MAPPPDVYVAISHITVPADGAADLVAAFRDRLGAVERWPGFHGLEVLRSHRDGERFVMITRWTSKADFLAYMRSADHRASHARIPCGPAAPRPAGFEDYEVVAW